MTVKPTFSRPAGSPSKPSDSAETFKGYDEAMKTKNKRIYLVDSGLSFNLPFPLLLRPQRHVQLYIVFDFSSRSSDSTPPFRVSIYSYLELMQGDHKKS